MVNLTKYPLEDGFETSLAQNWDGQLGTVNLNKVPAFTFPSGVTTYIVVDPGKTNMQIAEINSINVGNKTVNVSNITLEKGAGINSIAKNHTVNAKVIISDNYQFWKDILTAVNSKLDSDGGNGTTSFDLQVTGSNFRIRKDGPDMKLRDDNNPEVSLSALASASGVDKKVSITINDTTSGVLDTKLTAGDGIIKQVTSPGGDEKLELGVDMNYINNNITPVVKSTKETFVAGETITQADIDNGNNAVRCGGLYTNNQLLGGIEIGLLFNSANFEVGQNININGILTEISLKFKKNGTGGDGIFNIEIFSDSAFTNLIGTSNEQITASSVPTSFTEYNFTFNNLNVNNYYYKINAVSGSVNSTNYIGAEVNGTNPRTELLYRFSNTNVITSDNTYDMYFKSKYTEDTTKIYKTDASNPNKINFIGFATTPATTGNNVVVDTGGLHTRTIASGDIGKDFYLTNTPGSISTTPGTNVVNVGKAVESGILINAFDKKLTSFTLTSLQSPSGSFNSIQYSVGVKLNRNAIIQVTLGGISGSNTNSNGLQYSWNGIDWIDFFNRTGGTLGADSFVIELKAGTYIRCYQGGTGLPAMDAYVLARWQN